MRTQPQHNMPCTVHAAGGRTDTGVALAPRQVSPKPAPPRGNLQLIGPSCQPSKRLAPTPSPNSGHFSRHDCIFACCCAKMCAGVQPTPLNVATLVAFHTTRIVGSGFSLSFEEQRWTICHWVFDGHQDISQHLDNWLGWSSQS